MLSIQEMLLTVMRGAYDIYQIPDYNAWISQTVLPVLETTDSKIQALVSMVAQLGGDTPKIQLVLGRECSDEKLESMQPYLYKLLQNWIQTRQPYTEPAPHPNIPQVYLHGQMDLSGRMASLFWWLGRPTINAHEQQQQNHLLETIKPFMHRALQQVLHKQLEQQRPTLTIKQMELLHWLAQGCSNREIAKALQKSEHTVRNQIHTLFIKIQASNRLEALHIAEQHGLLCSWRWKKFN